MLKFLFPLSWWRAGRFELARDGLGGCCCGTWAIVVAGGVSLIGTGVTAYGANKQNKANQSAQDRTIASQQDASRQDWLNYLLQRGIAPGPDTQAGMVPGVTPGAAMNTRLPIWMRTTGAATTSPTAVPMASQNPTAKIPFIRKKGGP